MEDFVEDVSSNLIALMQQFITEPYYVRILGINSPELQEAIQERSSVSGQGAVTQQSGFTFTSEDIEGEYDVEPVSGSSTPIDRPEKIKTILQLLELAPKSGILPGGPFMAALAKELIELLGMPVLELALIAEQQAQAAVNKESTAKEDELTQLNITKASSEQQLDAENAATKQNKVMVDFMRMLKETDIDEQALMVELIKSKQQAAQRTKK